LNGKREVTSSSLSSIIIHSLARGLALLQAANKTKPVHSFEGSRFQLVRHLGNHVTIYRAERERRLYSDSLPVDHHHSRLCARRTTLIFFNCLI